MSYLNSVTIVGFVGADPEQRQARNNNGSKFTVLSVATQRSWKNTDDEWASKTLRTTPCPFCGRRDDWERPLGIGFCIDTISLSEITVLSLAPTF
jgi:hypothetical protein